MTLKEPVDPITRSIYQFVLRTFAQTGLPPSVDAIVKALNLPDLAMAEQYVNDIQAKDGLYRDGATGQILSAYPFSAAPTVHRVTLAGKQDVYAMCAIDALGMPLMLDMDAVIHSNCPQCGNAITLNITKGAIAGVNPRKVVVVRASASATCCAATAQCPYINYFCNADHARLWQSSQAQLTSTVLSLAEAFERGRTVFADLLRTPDNIPGV